MFIIENVFHYVPAKCCLRSLSLRAVRRLTYAQRRHVSPISKYLFYYYILLITASARNNKCTRSRWT